MSGAGVEPALPAPSQRGVSGWAALRRDPTRFSELAVLHALPMISPSVAIWNSELPVTLTEEERTRLTKATVRRSAGVSRRFGIIIGSSFYVGMAPAMTVTYIEQILVVLRVASIYGRDPANPDRAAEILCFQGRYRTVDQAQAALKAATTVMPKKGHRSRRSALKEAIRQLPPMLGIQLRHGTTPAEVILNALKIVALLIPVISIPLWVYVNGRNANRIGQSATNYYARKEAEPATADLTLPSPPSRRRVRTALITTGLVLATLAAIIPLGWYSHRLPLGGVALAEIAITLAMHRLLLITRPGTPGRSGKDSPPPVGTCRSNGRP